MNQMEKESKLWGEIKEDLRRQGNVGEYGFESYISQLKLKSDTGTKLVLEYPVDMFIDWVETYYSNDIRMSAARVLDAARELEYVPACADCPEQAYNDDEQEPSLFTPALSASCNIPANTTTDRKRKTNRRRHNNINSGLNSDYTFDSFVVGSNSEFAVAAAKAVVNAPSSMYNPLFIHGASGLGKTHLLQAIGNAIREKDDSVQVLYVTSEDFTNTYIDAISRQGDSLSNFRRKYRKADVLLIDDVQFLSQKGKTQEEFFHTFNALFASGKQIVLSADCPASEITRLDDRLTSRFEQGLTVALNVPDLETRIAILRKKRRLWKSTLISDEVLEYLAKNITRSVRRLEGALVRLATFASFSQKSPTVQDARVQLNDLLKEEKNTTDVTVADIQRRVAEEFNIRVADINGRRRTANIAHPRQVAMFLARRHTQNSLQDIGAAFGGRDHGTVIHATKTIEEKMETDPTLRDLVDRLASSLA
ncbi:MAG: chromosomal replication initiator protein DnaA [Akkermansia sp.]|nr:chromosomal replication initiator protein DnaA [Akkermansia sp.]